MLQEGHAFAFDDSFEHEAWNMAREVSTGADKEAGACTDAATGAGGYPSSEPELAESSSTTGTGLSDGDRLVLIVDVWHPDLSDAEVKMFKFLQAAQMRAARAASSRGLVKGSDDFVGLIAGADRSSVHAQEASGAV